MPVAARHLKKFKFNGPRVWTTHCISSKHAYIIHSVQ